MKMTTKRTMKTKTVDDDQDEDDKEGPCGPLVMDNVHVVKEHVIVLQLADGHHKGLDEGQTPVVEVGLVLQQGVEAERE